MGKGGRNESYRQEIIKGKGGKEGGSRNGVLPGARSLPDHRVTLSTGVCCLVDGGENAKQSKVPLPVVDLLYFSLSNMPSSFLPQGPRSCYSWALMFFPALPCCVSFLFLQVGAPLSLPGWPTLTALPCWLALTSAVMPCAFAWSLSWGMAVSILA